MLRLCVHEGVWQFTQRGKHKEDGFLLGVTHKSVSVFIQRLLSVYAALLFSLSPLSANTGKKIVSLLYFAFPFPKQYGYILNSLELAFELWNFKYYSCLNIFFKLLLGAIWWKSTMWSTTEACRPKSGISRRLMIHSIPNWAKCVFFISPVRC